MTPLPILDLIAGLIFVYFLLAILNNSLFELVAAFLKLRAYYLRDWLETTFSNKVKMNTLASAIMDHPLLSGLTKNGKSTTYIDAKSFTPALLEIVFTNFHPSGTPYTIENLRKALVGTTVLPQALKDAFLLFIDKTTAAQTAAKAMNTAINELEHFEKQVSDWFDAIMERVGSKFKRNSVIFTSIFATILTVSLNVDSIEIANYLYSNPDKRTEWAAAAYDKIADSTTFVNIQNLEAASAMSAGSNKAAADSTKKTLEDFKREVDKEKALVRKTMGTLNANLPVGWSDAECNYFKESAGKKLGGWLMTIMAICLGAPFWFEVLAKIANIRSSIKPPSGADEKK
ncbi:MAG: hypothetical protein ACJ77K_09620 [Bacteroidia bacterium]